LSADGSTDRLKAYVGFGLVEANKMLAGGIVRQS
jgi:hypothetical protein